MAQLKFEKKGYLVTVGAIRQSKGNMTEVSVTNHGNVDRRKLPFPPGAEISPNRSEFQNCLTTLSVEEAFAFYRKELPGLGWKEVKVLGQGTMRFTQNGMELRLEIGRNINQKTAVKITTGIRI